MIIHRRIQTYFSERFIWGVLNFWNTTIKFDLDEKLIEKSGKLIEELSCKIEKFLTSLIYTIATCFLVSGDHTGLQPHLT